MSSRVTRDHHSLSRNLKLNGKYISNDGGSDGISIDNYGTVLVGGQDTSGRTALNVVADENPYVSIYGEGDNYSGLKMYEGGGVTQNDYFDINVQHDGATTITTVDAAGSSANLNIITDGNLSLSPTGGKELDISQTYNSTSGSVFTFHKSDLIRTGDISSGINSITNFNCSTRQTGSSGGTHTITGINNLVEGDSGGTTTCYGFKQSILPTPGGAMFDTVIGIQSMHAAGTHMKLMYDAGDYSTFTVSSSGDLNIETVGSGTRDSDIVLDADGGIKLDAANGVFDFYDDGDTDDAFKITVIGGTGNTTLETVSAAADGFLTLKPDASAVIIDSADLQLYPTQKLYFDNGGNTYIREASADLLQLYVGGDVLLELDENGADGNIVWFRDSCAGFTRIEQTFSTTDVKGTGGSDDTDIDFRKSNKFRLELTADIAQMNLIFPAVSGNFTLVTSTNGDHDVTAWKVWEYDESAATTTDVMWPGGSVPAFTSSGVDITSFYWDATEQQCYGITSLAFAAP